MSRLISDKFKEWEAECDDRFNQLKANEEDLNRMFIEIYGLQDELTLKWKSVMLPPARQNCSGRSRV